MNETFLWSQEKNRWLIRERSVSFEAVVACIEEGGILAIVPGKGKYKHQQQFLVLMHQYVYIVPFVENKEGVFLKTIIPSRKLTRRYIAEEM